MQSGSSENVPRSQVHLASVFIGAASSSMDSAAAFQVKSTTQGVGVPVMTTTQKNAVASPVAGLVVFDSTLGKLCVYTGVAWQTITSA